MKREPENTPEPEDTPEPQGRKLLALLHKEPNESLEAFIARAVAATAQARASAHPPTEGGDS
jgi:hypothetical protein